MIACSSDISGRLTLVDALRGFALSGTYGRLGVGAAFATGCVLWLLQAGGSAWWLRRHRIGPAEWVWRKVAAA